MTMITLQLQYKGKNVQASNIHLQAFHFLEGFLVLIGLLFQLVKAFGAEFPELLDFTS